MKKLIWFIERLLDKIIKIPSPVRLHIPASDVESKAGIRQSNEFNSTHALAASALPSC